MDRSHAELPEFVHMFHYDAPAEVYLAHSNVRRRGKLSYHRFSTADEAIRFAVNELPGPRLRGTIMVVFEERFDHRAIRSLYDAMNASPAETD